MTPFVRFVVEVFRLSFSEESVSGHHVSYGWHYWPHDNCRSACGLAGMINLGATCYMASCMQQLYMMPEARTSILKVQVCGTPFTLSSRIKLHLFVYLLY